MNFYTLIFISTILMIFLDTQRCHRYHERRHLVPQKVLSIESCQAKSPGPWCGEKSGWCESQIVPWYMIIFEWLEATFSHWFDTFWEFTETLNGQYIHPISIFLEHSFRSTDPACMIFRKENQCNFAWYIFFDLFQSEFPRHDLTFGKQVGTSTWNSDGKCR